MYLYIYSLPKMQKPVFSGSSFNFIYLFCGFLFFLQVPPQVGTAPLMAPQSMMYTQPGLRPTNPFAPVSETQVNSAL